MKKWLYSICSFLSTMTKLAIPIFDHAHPKRFLINFWFLWPRINMQTISLLHQLFLEIQSILESRDQIGHTHFWPCPIKKLFNQLVSTCKNWGRFIDLLWRNAWFKNLAIGMAESILACISETTFFPNRRSVQEYNK